VCRIPAATAAAEKISRLNVDITVAQSWEYYWLFMNA